MKAKTEFLIFLIAILSIQSSFSQTGSIVTIAGDVITCPETVSIPLMVENCNGVGAISLTLLYNADVLEFSGYEQLHSELSGGFLIVNAFNQKVVISFATMDSISIGNDTLMVLEFTSNGGNSTLIWDTITSGSCEYSDMNGNVLPAYYDNGNVEVYFQPSILQQPTDQDIIVGESATFDVAVTGTDIAYQWQESLDGNAWNDLFDSGIYSGVLSPTLALSAPGIELNGYYYRCLVSGTCLPDAFSDTVQLTIFPTPQLISVIVGEQTVCPGEISVPVNVLDCNGVGAISMALQFNTEVIEFTGYQNVHSELLTGEVVVNAKDGIVYFNWASTIAANVGDDVLVEFIFNTSTGFSNLTWDTNQCEFSTLGGEIINSEYANGAIGIQQPPLITQQPVNSTVIVGANSNFTMDASGNGLGFQWQLSTNGNTWENLLDAGNYIGVNSITLQVNNTTLDMNGNLYRCLVIGSCPPEAITNPAQLTVSPVSQLITVTLSDFAECPGQFTVPVEVTDCNGVGAISLVLQYDNNLLEFVTYQNIHSDFLNGNLVVNNLEGKIYFNWASTSIANIGSDILVEFLFEVIPGTSALNWLTGNGNCEFSDASGQIINSVYVDGNLSVYQPPVINSQPEDVVIIEGENASFQISATGTGLEYQWQVSVDSLNWNDLNNSTLYFGVTTPTLSIQGAAVSLNSIQYRCTVDGTCPPQAISEQATLFVQPTPQLITTMVSSINGSCTGNVSVEVTVKDFTGVGAFSLTLQFDPVKVRFDGFENLHPSLEQGMYVIDSAGSRIYMSWASSNAANIGDGKLVDLLFVSQEGSSNLNWDTNTLGNCEFSTALGEVINSDYVDGSLNIDANALIADAGQDKTITIGEVVELSGSASGGSLPYSFSWAPGGDGQSIFVNPTESTCYALTVSDGSCSSTDWVLIDVIGSTQDVTINAGWTGISSFILPIDTSIESVLQSVLDDLTILVDYDGNIFRPDGGINTIQNWESQNGYWIKMEKSGNITFAGGRNENLELQLTTGWNLIPVLSEGAVAVTDLFDIQETIIVKEAVGTKLYWPEKEINTLEYLVPGGAYMVKMSADVTISFGD